MTTYQRGYGGITLLSDQISYLRTLLIQTQDDFASNPSQLGLGGTLYQALLSDISDPVSVLGVTVLVPKASN